MLKKLAVYLLVSGILVTGALCREIETLEDESIELPEKNPSKSNNNGLSFLRPADDALLNFIDKLVNTSYTSSKMLLNKVKAQNELRKEIEDQVGEFLESLPRIKIPILDTLTPRKSDVKDVEHKK
ncbi:uncharacterized protein [Diabrotica undecimpunctata]|uniref:uncharacterized protein n=1 Tax=Diabrotica undecimpunctata TaxID=50387 RepID=UPI003B64119A